MKKNHPLFTDQKVEEISIYIKKYLRSRKLRKIPQDTIWEILNEEKIFDSSKEDLIDLFHHSWDKKLGLIDGLWWEDNLWSIYLTPEILYHYTSMDTLVKILKTCSKPTEYDLLLNFRATNVNYLNDQTEARYFVDCLCDAVDELNKEEEEDLKETWIRTNFKDIAYPDLLFIVSLSECEDELLMWRGYANNGQGVALGFDFHRLNINFRHQLVQCRYRKKSDIENFAKKHLKRINSYQSNLGNDLRIHSFLNSTRLCTKHPAYKEEKEWRILWEKKNYNPVDNWGEIEGIDYDCKNGFIYPFMNIPIPFECLKSIYIGPCSGDDNSSDTLKKIINGSFNNKSCEIFTSKIPYRNR